MKFIKNLFKKQQLYIKEDSKITNLRSKIIEAKNKVRFDICDPRCGFKGSNAIDVLNYHEIRLILGYEDTLGMTLFVKHYIAGDVDTEKCLNFLLTIVGDPFTFKEIKNESST